jgi:hypothetical protein
LAAGIKIEVAARAGAFQEMERLSGGNRGITRAIRL